MENVADGEKSQKTNPAEYDKYCFLIKRWSKTFNFVVLLAVMAISFLSYTHWAWMFVYAFSLSVLVAFGHGLYGIDEAALAAIAIRFFLFYLNYLDVVYLPDISTWGVWIGIASIVAALVNFWIVKVRGDDANVILNESIKKLGE